MHTHTKRLATVAMMTVAAFVLVSCSGGTPVEPKEAKQAVVGIVERSTESLGSGWEVATGPRLGKCSGGGDGVTYVFAKKRAAGDPRADIDTVEALWKQRGITTQRYESGGDDPILGIRGAGGPTTSIDFNADPRGYTINGVSECADGDFDQMVDEEQSDPAR